MGGKRGVELGRKTGRKREGEMERGEGEVGRQREGKSEGSRGEGRDRGCRVAVRQSYLRGRDRSFYPRITLHQLTFYYNRLHLIEKARA